MPKGATGPRAHRAVSHSNRGEKHEDEGRKAGMAKPKKAGKSKSVTVLPPAQVIADIASQSPAATKHRPTHVKRQLRVDLTTQELANLSNQLDQAVANLQEAENDKAEEMSNFNAHIKAHRASISKLAQQVNLGYEMREVDCPIEYNTPRVGQKTIAHPETGKPLAVEAMGEDERQENLFPDEHPKPQTGEEAAKNLATFQGKDKPKSNGADPDAAAQIPSPGKPDKRLEFPGADATDAKGTV